MAHRESNRLREDEDLSAPVTVVVSTRRTAPYGIKSARAWIGESRWRLAQLYAGLTLYGIATALRVRANLGLDPWSVFHQGLAKTTGLSFGTTIMVVGAIILILWIPMRQKPGLGTISNIVVIGIAADAALAVLPNAHALPAELGFTLMGTMMTGFAGATYMGARFGNGPRDGLMMGIVDRTGWPVKRVRAGMELTVLAVGWLLGGAVGIGTVSHALLIGPCLDRSMRFFAPGSPSPGRT